MTNTCCAIQSKKDALAYRCQGAVIASEPKIIWAKMIERVGGDYDRALTVRYRFNAAVEDQLADRKDHYIFDVSKVIAEPHYFNQRNELNEDRMHKFWREIDKLLELFNYDKEKFKPIRQIQFERKPHKPQHSFRKRKDKHRSKSKY